MKRKDYEKKLEKLQVELCHLQEWVKAEKLKVIIIFEGRTPPARAAPSRP
jgi:polyphosphate kinase 2 (PPK2 family)